MYDGELGPVRVEFRPWRAARGLEPVEEEMEPRRRTSAALRCPVWPPGAKLAFC